VECFGNPHYA